MSDRLYEITVIAAEITPEEAEALFDRVADVVHELDQQVICSGRWTEVEG